MKAKIVKWIVAPIIGFLAGVAFDHFVWNTPWKESCFSMLCATVVILIVFGLFDRKGSKRETQA